MRLSSYMNLVFDVPEIGVLVRDRAARAKHPLEVTAADLEIFVNINIQFIAYRPFESLDLNAKPNYKMIRQGTSPDKKYIETYRIFYMIEGEIMPRQVTAVSATTVASLLRYVKHHVFDRYQRQGLSSRFLFVVKDVSWVHPNTGETLMLTLEIFRFPPDFTVPTV